MIRAFTRTFGFINKHPLASKHLFKAYYKFLKWQLISRLSNGLIKTNFIQHTRFYAKKNLTGVTGNIYAGLHEFEDMSFLIHFLKAGDVFFDVGANVGSYSILASGICKAQTIAFEPIEDAYQILEKNIVLNKLEEFVTVECKGVGSEIKTAFFTTNKDTSNHILSESQENSKEIDIVALDSYYSKKKPTLLKIDVEGFETEVLNGADRILNDNNLKAIIIELNGSGERYGFDDREIHKKLLGLSFVPVSYDPFKRMFTKLDSFGKFNTIYVKDMDFVENRIKSSAPFSVFNEKI